MALGSSASEYISEGYPVTAVSVTKRTDQQRDTHNVTQVSGPEYSRLKKQATRLQHLLQVMPAGVVVVDGKGYVRQANPQASDLLGEPLEGQLWRNIIARSFDPRDDDGHEVSLIDGRKVKLSITPLVDEPGQLIVLTDLTETRQLQQRISHMQRLSALGKTVASLVHQIRTPLSAAILYASNLGNGRLKEAARDTFTQKLISRLGELEGQVNDMLLFAKSGEQQVLQHCQLDSLLEDVRQSSDAMLQAASATLEIDVSPADLALVANQSALKGAIQNLIHNGVQMMPQGAHIRIRAYASDAHADWARIDVMDNGPGIKQQALARLFEPFFTTKSQGTGLGLAVVAAVAKSHGGRVDASNLADGGACFSLHLPLSPAKSPADIPDSANLRGVTE